MKQAHEDNLAGRQTDRQTDRQTTNKTKSKPRQLHRTSRLSFSEVRSRSSAAEPPSRYNLSARRHTSTQLDGRSRREWPTETKAQNTGKKAVCFCWLEQLSQHPHHRIRGLDPWRVETGTQGHPICGHFCFAATHHTSLQEDWHRGLANTPCDNTQGT